MVSLRSLSVGFYAKALKDLGATREESAEIVAIGIL